MTGLDASSDAVRPVDGRAATPPFDRTDATFLAVLLILGLAARAWIAIRFPGVDHPDETFQATEQAHRLVFGYGILPWEFRIGARNWLLPGFVAGLLKPLARIWPNPEDYLRALAIAFGTLSLLSVWAAYEIGRRFGRAHALAAGFAAAVWIELAYYGIRPLGEAIATNFLLVAIALLGREKPTPSRIFWGGVALGSASSSASTLPRRLPSSRSRAAGATGAGAGCRWRSGPRSRLPAWRCSTP
jgi:hypothetical protein